MNQELWELLKRLLCIEDLSSTAQPNVAAHVLQKLTEIVIKYETERIQIAFPMEEKFKGRRIKCDGACCDSMISASDWRLLCKCFMESGWRAVIIGENHNTVTVFCPTCWAESGGVQ